jgi:hypothetical protein
MYDNLKDLDDDQLYRMDMKGLLIIILLFFIAMFFIVESQPKSRFKNSIGNQKLDIYESPLTTSSVQFRL